MKSLIERIPPVYLVKKGTCGVLRWQCTCICSNTHIHARVHRYGHAFAQVCKHANMRARMHVCTCMFMFTCMCCVRLGVSIAAIGQHNHVHALERHIGHLPRIGHAIHLQSSTNSSIIRCHHRSGSMISSSSSCSSSSNVAQDGRARLGLGTSRSLSAAMYTITVHVGSESCFASVTPDSPPCQHVLVRVVRVAHVCCAWHTYFVSAVCIAHTARVVPCMCASCASCVPCITRAIRAMHCCRRAVLCSCMCRCICACAVFRHA